MRYCDITVNRTKKIQDSIHLSVPVHLFIHTNYNDDYLLIPTGFLLIFCSVNSEQVTEKEEMKLAE